MTAPSPTRSAVCLLSAALVLALPMSGRAQNRPITIPPATQITPPTLTPAAPPAAPPSSPPPSAPSGVVPAPRTLLPDNIETVRDPLGDGIVMYGQLTGKSDSALGVTSAIFAYSGAFDPAPAPLLAVADKNDRTAQTLFTATVRGATVLGVAVVALNDAGGNVSVFYDYADSFPASFPRLQQMLGPGRADTGLIQLHLADGSEISVAPGWRVIAQGRSVIDLAGAQGELMSLGDSLAVYAGPTALAGSVAQGPCCDPVAALQAVAPQIAAGGWLRRGLPWLALTDIAGSAATPAPAGGQGALVFANVTLCGKPYSWLALVEAVGGFTDPWTLRLSGAMAPQPVFAAEVPMLLQIWSSYSANPQDLAERLNAAAQGIEALRPMLQTAPDATQYRADGGWNDVISAFVTHPGAAGSKPVDDATARSLLDRLSKDGGGAWHIVPWPSR